MKTTPLLAALLLLIVLVSAACAEEGVTLRFQFTPGDTRSYDLNVTGGGQVVIAGTPMGDMTVPLDMVVNGAFDLITREVDLEGNGHLGLKLGAFAMEITAMGQTQHMVMDLEKGKFTVEGKDVTPPGAGPGAAPGAPPGLPPGEALDKLVFVMSPRGAPVDLQGMEEFAAAMRQGNPMGMMQPAMMPNVKAMLKDYAPPFPEGPVKPGDTWEQSFKVPMPGQAEPMALTVHYTLEDLGNIGDHQVARIGLAGDWEMKDLPMPPPAAGQPAPGKIDLMTMKTEGQIYFDVTAGAMHSARLALTLEMEMTAAAPQPPPPPEVEKPEQPGAGGPAPAPEEDQGNQPGAAGAPANGDQPPPAAPPAGDNQNQIKISLKNMKLYYNVFPHGGQPAAGEG